MARYKPYNLKQDKFIAVSYAEQILPGSFEHTLLSGHLKSGQSSTPQNRPVEAARRVAL